MKNKFFSHRSFIYNNVKELIPLLQCLINEKVKVKINMTKEFKDDYDEVIKVIGDYQYKRDE